MHYVVMDLEWNQASSREAVHPDLVFEIIEIGAVKLDESGCVVDEFDALIRPTVYPELYFRVREVVHMSTKLLEREGRPFAEVIEEFFAWCGPDAVFCTWGSMDLTEFQRNILYFGIENPFPFPLFYYDVQKLYSLSYEDGKARSALETAVDRLGLFMGEPFHRAVSDAYYTGLVMGALPMKQLKPMLSVDYFRLPRTPEEEIHLVFDTYSKFVSRIYPSREEAMRDAELTSTVCYRCNEPAKRRVNWFSDNARHYYTLAWCPKHGWLKGKIRTKKNPDGSVFMVKTLKLVPQNTAVDVLVKHEELKSKRREKRLK